MNAAVARMLGRFGGQLDAMNTHGDGWLVSVLVADRSVAWGFAETRDAAHDLLVADYGDDVASGACACCGGGGGVSLVRPLVVEQGAPRGARRVLARGSVLCRVCLGQAVEVIPED